MRAGIVGLGLLGKAMAERLVAAGFEVCGYDLRAEARIEARAVGVETMDGAPEVAAADVLLLSLPASEDRRALLWGPQALADVLRPGAIVLDTTTGRPTDLEADAARLHEQGVRLVDTCILGSSETVRQGGALALVGDRAENASPYAGILAAFTKSQHYFDLPGRACRAKLICNMVIGLHRAVLAEALGLAARDGFDLSAVLDVLRAGDAHSVAMDAKGPKMVSGEYEPPAARLAQHAKDVALIVEYARESGATIPLTEAHHALIAQLVRHGYGGLDNAAVFKAYAPD